MRTLGRALAALLVLLAVASLVVLFRRQPIPVDVARVARGPFERTVEEDGKTRVRERYVVSAPVHGRLLRIDLEEGDRVERGGSIAVIVPTAPPLLDARSREEGSERVSAAEAALRRADAALARARVALDQEQVDLARARSLHAEGVLARNELDRAELAVNVRIKEVSAAEFERDVAAHQLEMARASLRQLREDPAAPGSAVEPWEIRSPVPGRVLRVLQESESVVAPGTPLVELADPEDLEVVVDLLTSDAVQVQPGAPVRIEGWGGPEPLAGRVRLVEPGAFTKVSALGVEEQRVNVIVDIVSPPESWRSLGDAFRVDARIALDQRADALLVPTSALFRRGDRWAAYAIVDGKARERSVTLGPRGDRTAVVEDGLSEGDRVVVFPSDAIADGARVLEREAREG